VLASAAAALKLALPSPLDTRECALAPYGNRN
jgi:hypothetical protein